MAEKKDKKSESPFTREAKSYAKTAITFGISDFGETGQRIKNIAANLRAKKAAQRVETFSEAVERHQLTEKGIHDRAAQVKATSDLIGLIAVLAFVLLLAAVYLDWSFSIVTLLCLGAVWAICQTLVWRFRYDQIRARELFGFTDWLLGRRTGEFK